MKHFFSVKNFYRRIATPNVKLELDNNYIISRTELCLELI
ncbi:hypothetical protein BVRB_9g212150 [Beta vulgaris subsp. vulgaris]|nr:hypothetical protein BVRB_9g212150 [Beta vulgaris subsp. vulgaris]